MNSMLTICLLLGVTVSTIYGQDGSDPYMAHGGIFRALKLNEDELNYVSSLHAMADFHTLMDFITEKMESTEMSAVDRAKIQSFLHKNRPPLVVSTFLSNSDRQKIRHFHREKDLDSIFKIIGERLLELDPADRLQAINYIWPNADDFVFEYFELDN